MLYGYITRSSNWYGNIFFNKAQFIAAWKSNLKAHFEIVQNNIKGFKCNICKYTALTKIYLDGHTKAVHNKIRDHSSSSLKSHFEKHTNGIHKDNLEQQLVTNNSKEQDGCLDPITYYLMSK